jgi:hypothetical protein
MCITHLGHLCRLTLVSENGTSILPGKTEEKLEFKFHHNDLALKP